MNKLLQDILAHASGDDPVLRNEAEHELILLIEKHTSRRDSEDHYRSMLRDEVVSMVLSEDEQRELIGAIGRIVLSDECSPRIVAALSKATSVQALEYLLAYLRNDARQRDKDCIWEALIGVQPFSTVQRDDGIYETVFRLFREYNLADSLRSITNEHGEDTAALAQRILSRIPK